MAHTLHFIQIFEVGTVEKVKVEKNGFKVRERKNREKHFTGREVRVFLAKLCGGMLKEVL